MRINWEQMNELESWENVCRRKKTLRLGNATVDSTSKRRKEKSIIITASRLRRCFQQNIYDELWIEVIPFLPWNVCGAWIFIYLTHLLDVRNGAKQKREAINRVPCKIYKVPQVPQVASNAFSVNLPRFFPDEPEDVDENKHLQRRRCVSALLFHWFLQSTFHRVRPKQQNYLNFRPLADQN